MTPQNLLRRALIPGAILSLTAWLAAPPASAAGTPFCFGDGSVGSTACPCANTGAAGNGCANSVYAAGGNLTCSGTPGSTAGTDTLVLTASNIPAVGLFFCGTGTAGGGAGVVFGDGLMCASGTITRLAVVFANSSGVATYDPVSNTSLTKIHVLAGTVSTNVRHHQFWYRDSSPTFCTSAFYNLTNGLTITSVP